MYKKYCTFCLFAIVCLNRISVSPIFAGVVARGATFDKIKVSERYCEDPSGILLRWIGFVSGVIKVLSAR